MPDTHRAQVDDARMRSRSTLTGSKKGEEMGLVSAHTIITGLILALASTGANPTSTDGAAAPAASKTASKLCTFRVVEAKGLLSAHAGGIMHVQFGLSAETDGFPVASRHFELESSYENKVRCDLDAFKRVVLSSTGVGSVDFSFTSAQYDERDSANQLFETGNLLSDKAHVRFAPDHTGDYIFGFSKSSAPSRPFVQLTCEIKEYDSVEARRYSVSVDKYEVVHDVSDSTADKAAFAFPIRVEVTAASVDIPSQRLGGVDANLLVTEKQVSLQGATELHFQSQSVAGSFPTLCFTGATGAKAKNAVVKAAITKRDGTSEVALGYSVVAYDLFGLTVGETISCESIARPQNNDPAFPTVKLTVHVKRDS